jgi:hypothetical protein
MTIFRIIAAALALFAGLAFLPGAAAAASGQCRYSADQYAQAIRYFESEAARARALAAQNPLYQSDLAYINAVLADARACYRQLGPVATAAR